MWYIIKYSNTDDDYSWAFIHKFSTYGLTNIHTFIKGERASLKQLLFATSFSVGSNKDHSTRTTSAAKNNTAKTVKIKTKSTSASVAIRKTILLSGTEQKSWW